MAIKKSLRDRPVVDYRKINEHGLEGSVLSPPYVLNNTENQNKADQARNQSLMKKTSGRKRNYLTARLKELRQAKQFKPCGKKLLELKET